MGIQRVIIVPRRYVSRRVRVATAIMWTATITALLLIGLLAIGQGRERRPARFASLPISTCHQSNGSGDSQTYPCMSRAAGLGTPMIVVYARGEEGCPVVLATGVACVYAREWWGGHDGD